MNASTRSLASLRMSAPAILNRIVPLAPDVALRIKPDIAADQDRVDLSFPNFGYVNRRPGRAELVRLNRSIVRCAEDFVFYRDTHRGYDRSSLKTDGIA